MFEHVIAEQDYYDGPKSGIALFSGIPHRFAAKFDESQDEYSEIFQLWPISEADLRLEIEQWNIFVAWNSLYEAGAASTESHPALGGIDSRWDELETQLTHTRVPPETGATLARGEFQRLDRDQRYHTSGPDYLVEWSVLAAG